MNIKCTQNIFKSANGVSNVSYYILCPEDVPLRGVVQVVHGMCEYFSRYTPFAKYLCSLGLVVCGHDHVGHGASVTRQDDLGFFSPRDGWRVLVRDTYTVTQLMRERYPDLPYFLLGHSMGSLVARLYLSRYGENLTGAILSGTAASNPMAKTGIRMADSVARAKGMTYRSAFLSHLAFRGYNRRIKSRHSAFDWLSRDAQVVELYESDEKCNFVFTAVGFRDLFRLLVQANAIKCYRHTPHNLPILLIAGDCDPVGAYGEGVRQVANLYRSQGQKNVDVIFYKGARHEILNEINRLDVYGDISHWLEDLLAQAAEARAAETEAPEGPLPPAEKREA